MLVKTKIFISLLLLFIATVLVFSYAKSNEENKVELNIGDKTVCPVMGGEFTITESTPVIEYKGKKYYFCCPGCDKEFSKNPEKYIKEISTTEEELTDEDIIGKEEQKPQTTDPELKTTGPEKEKTTKEILYWTCSMHPEVKADKEGNCPICSMNLIPVYEKEGSEGSLYLNDRAIELAGIRIVPATRHHLYVVINTVGRVAYDPELVIAQEEYLNALEVMEMMNASDERTMKRAASVVEKSKYRLRLLGMDESEIEKLNKTRQVETSLIIPENETWIYADVYESDISWIKKRQDVVVTTIAYPGEKFSGKISSINPTLNSQTRSVRLRIQLFNANRELKPGMYVDVRIAALYRIPLAKKYTNNQKILAVHKESVLDTGNRKIVWVYLGDGKFQPREVELGPESVFHDGDRSLRCFPVLKGLEENELVVTNGNFLIDSESQLTGIAAIEYGGAIGIEENPKSLDEKK